MLDPINITGVGGILLLMIVACSIALIVLTLRDRRSNQEMRARVREDFRTARAASLMLKKISVRADKLITELHGRENERVMDEMKKVGSLWKSKKERIREGLWETIETEPKELTDLKKKKDEINSLIERAKVKYHKRELDEESFREIIAGYQKEVMEIDLKINEFEES